MLNNYLQTDEIPTDQQPGRGKLVGQKPPLKPKEVWSIRALLQLNEKVRDLALFNVAIDSKLRSCDLVALRVSDVTVAGSVRERAVIVQQKTGHPVQFELTEQTREAVQAWIHHELETIEPLITEAAAQANPDARIRFQYDWLRQDLNRIRRGIEEHIDAPRSEPRTFPPLRGDYRR